ncbi:MAG TPA: hypothetical protein PKA82_15500 [Pyrinomonadaceae bacterium]|nr:hypothetical protein [Pyrinomonadaceae bacterium]
MSKKLTDEQADQLLRSFVQETQVSDDQIDEIADAPQLWWAVQRNIAAEKKAVAAPWPPSFNWLRFLSFATPVAALLLVAFLIFSFRPTQKTDVAGLQQNDVPQSKIVSPDVRSEPAAPQTTQDVRSNIVATKTASVQVSSSKKAATAQRISTSDRKDPKQQVAAEEVRSDFIALTYAQRPESGQIVRVKVPQSMKVSLGVASSVDKPSDLVDAEVLVGDDGMTHAIRFISSGNQQ